MKNELMTIDFHGDKVFMVEHSGEPYVPLKPIVENIGLDWKTQQEKVSKDKKWNYRHIPIVAGDGKRREMGCLPLNRTRAWLFSINSSKVRHDLRVKIEQYQEECCDVLDSYWNKGIAINPRVQPAPVVDTVNISKDRYIELLEAENTLLKGADQDFKEYYSITEAMMKLDIAYHTVWREIRRGRLKAVLVAGVWRIHRDDLDEYIRLNHFPALN